MRLSLSVAASDRTFAKAMRRVRPSFELLCQEFGKIELESPIHEAILLGFTDSRDAGYLAEEKNRDGFFQVIAGCNWPATDEQLRKAMIDSILRAVRLCPFTTNDRVRFEELVRNWGQS
jgi:hypothetical protein